MENKPILRFQEYRNTWESIELGQVIASLKSGLSRMLSNDDIGLPVVRANNINEGVLDLEKDIKYWYADDPQGAKTSNYYISTNDILVNFINSEAKMGTAAFLESEPKRPTIYTTNIMNLRINERADPYFIYVLTNTNHYKNYVKLITKPAVNQASFTTVDFKKFTFNIPRIEEQREISSFFRNLEKTIVYHQQELDTLKQTKQGFLQKMFPKEGETVPELRFPGFNGEWKLSRLGELTSITMGQSPNSENYTSNPDNYILVQGNADMKNGWVTPRVWTTQVTKIAEKGNIILSVRAPVGDVGKTQYDVVLGRGVAGIKGDEFIYQVLIKMKSDGYWTRYSTGSTFESINSLDIKEATLRIPEKKEQQKIGNFFKQLDKTFELHEKELEALKETKKAFLQKMFV